MGLYLGPYLLLGIVEKKIAVRGEGRHSSVVQTVYDS